MNRRELLRGILAAPLVSALPLTSYVPGPVMVEGVGYSTGFLTTGSSPRLLQEGIHKLVTEQYADYPAHYFKAFAK